MPSLQIPDSHLEALNNIISQLNRREVLTSGESDRLYEASSRKAMKMVFDESEPFGVALGYPDEYKKTEKEFFSYMRLINDDLHEQVRLFSQFVELWFSMGEAPPPHYPNRIAIILRKAKLFDLEKDFLSAYFKHFWFELGSSTDTKLGERAKKIGISIPAIPDRSSFVGAEGKKLAAEYKIKNLSVDIEPPNEPIGSKTTFNYKFYCLQCAGTVINVDDESNKLSLVKCTKCETEFGSWGNIYMWLTDLSKIYLDLRS